MSTTPLPNDAKVIGVGLNKTGTKTLRQYLERWGFNHRSYDLDSFNRYRAGDIEYLLGEMSRFDSFEDWPWPLLYSEADERFPGSKFVLTVRSSGDAWFRSLCKMAVRMGPLQDFEEHIYGYAMPQGHKQEHLDFYADHNEAVTRHFADRPEQLLTICWEDGDGPEKLAEFLQLDAVPGPPAHVNRGVDVYGGDNLAVAQANRIAFQSYWRTRRAISRALGRS